jgi:nicotinamidase-related amidase
MLEDHWLHQEPLSDPYTTPSPSRSLLITIDVQNDFCLGGARVPGALEVVPAICAVADAFRAARRPIVHIVRLYTADGANADLCRRSLIEGGARIATPGSARADLVADLKPDPSPSMDSAALLRGEAQSLGPNERLLYKPRLQAALERLLSNATAVDHRRP